MAVVKEYLVQVGEGIFSWQKIILFTITFSAIIIILQRTTRYACANWVTFDCPFYFPLSIFNLRLPTLENLLFAVVAGFIFLISTRYLESKRFKLSRVIIVGGMLIISSTLIQGVMTGFYAPIAGDARGETLIPYTTDGQEYYHDGLKISDPISFFSNYNELQPTLNQHAHTHPPGAVLTLYYLEKILGDPALIALALMVLATVLTGFFFHRLILTESDSGTAGYMTFLLLILPAIQIYYLATLDALITGLLTATLYLFCFQSGRRGCLAAIITLSSSLLLTFASLFILPVLVGFDLIVKRSLKRSFIVVGGMVVIHIFFFVFMGYNALQAFRTASLYENPAGFMLFANPINYIVTRIEDIAEILLFFGPFLLVLMIKGLKNLRLEPLTVLAILGCGTLIAMFVTGAWRTGETARACAFIYPYLLFPVSCYLVKHKISSGARLQVAFLVFGQTLVMQGFGHYHW